MIGADRVLAIGSALWRRAESDLRPWTQAPRPVRIDPGFDLQGAPAKCPPADGARKVLVAGRLEDHDIKGLDVAVRAVAGAIHLCTGSTRGVALLLRGVPAGERAKTEAKVLEWAGTELDVDLHRYSGNPLDIQQDLRRSVLVLMPSRAEGFGLVGQEAIVAGVPVLVSSRSGLGELLLDEAAELAGEIVLPVNRDGCDVELWSKAVAAVLDSPGTAFARAAQLRERMSQRRSWARTAHRVLQAWAVAPRRFGRDPATKLPSRTALLCGDGDACEAFLVRLHEALREMVDYIDPEIAPANGEPTAWSPDVVLCALSEDNRRHSCSAELDHTLAEAHRLDRPVVFLRLRPGASVPPSLSDSHTVDATGPFLETLATLTEYLAGLDDGRSLAAEEVAGRDGAVTKRLTNHGRFLPINEMPGIASAGFEDRAETVALVLRGLAGERYRLIVLKGQDGVGKTAVVRAIRDREEEAAEPSLRALVYFSARGYRWISAPTLLADLAGLAGELDRDRLLEEVRTTPWEAVVGKVLAKIGSAPIAVVVDDADRLFDQDGNWVDADLLELITQLVSKGGHPVSVLLLVQVMPTALGAHALQRHLLPVDLIEGLPFRPYAEDLMRRMDDERGTLGLSGASTAQLERLHNGTGGLPRSMELVAALLTLNRSVTVNEVANLLDDAVDPPEALFVEIFGRLQLEERRVLQALGVLVRPVPPDAVAFLLAEAHPTLRAAASLEYLRHARVVHSYGDRYYLPAAQADLVLSTLPSKENAGSASMLVKDQLQSRGAAYFHSHRSASVDTIADLWPQFGEIELLMRMQDWEQALVLINEIDDVYLSRWGQSHVLTPWRMSLKEVLESPESRGANLSYLRAAARQYDGATDGLEGIKEALELARELRDEKNVIITTVQLANLLADRGQLVDAIEKYHEAREKSQTFGQLGLEVKARTGLAACAAKRGDFDLAERELGEVARLNDEMGLSPQGDDRRSSQLVNQAWVLGQRGNYRAARSLLLRAQVLADRLCSDARSAWVLGGLAVNALAMGDVERAVLLARDGVRVARRLDNHRLIREISATLGFALLAAGDPAAAAEAAESATGDFLRLAGYNVLNLKGMAAFRLSEEAAARAAFVDAVRGVQTRNQRRDDYQLLDAEGLALTGLALLGDASPEDALQAFREARALTREAGVLAHNKFLLGLYGSHANQPVLAGISSVATAFYS